MKTHKTANENLSANEDKYRVLFESNRDSVTINRIDYEGSPSHFIEANPATTELFGFTQKELLSMSINDFETLTENETKSRIEILESKGKLDFETIIKDKKGNHRNVEVKTVLINYKGSPAIMNISRDITTRKQIEENTRKTQENLVTILDAIPDLLFEVNFDGTIYHYQAHREDLLAVSPSEIIGKKFQNLMPIEVTKTCFAAIEEADQKGWSMGKQYSLDLPSGKHWFELSVSSVKENSETDKRYIILARDITYRKQIEHDLQENKDNLQSIFDSVSEAIYVLDKNGTFIDVNKGAEKMYLYSREELIGQTPQSVAAPGLNDFEEVNRIMQSVFENGIPLSL